MVSIPNVITAAWLNSLTDAERIELAKTPFMQRLHYWAASHVTYLWWLRESPLGLTTVNNGSAFFLSLGERLLAVTAAHVYDGYLAEKKISRGRIRCRIGNVPFDPEVRLRGYRTGIDIATFELTYDELKEIGKQAMLADAASWPPVHPFSGQGTFLAGFPGVLRLWTGLHEVNFGLYTALTPINSAGDSQITCPFERAHWVNTIGNRLPPEGMRLGGISGGPLLLPIERDGVWSLQLAGVISQAATESYETVASVPAHFIAFDGSIKSKRSAPLRFAVPGDVGQGRKL